MIFQAFNVLSAVMKQRHEPGVKLKCKVLEVRDVDVSAVIIQCGCVCVIMYRAVHTDFDPEVI